MFPAISRLSIAQKFAALKMSSPLINAASDVKWRIWPTVQKATASRTDIDRLNTALAKDVRHRIGISLLDGISLEHTRGLATELDESKTMLPILVGVRAMTNGKGELAAYLRQRRTIDENRAVFFFPWIKNLSIEVLFDSSVTRFPTPKTCKRILYAHGMAGLNFAKNSEAVTLVKYYDALFLNGPMHRRALEIAAHSHGVRLPTMYDIGYLRGDRLRLLSHAFDRKAFADRHALDAGPIVTYAPTWGEFSSTKDWIETTIAVCESLGVNLFLRLHPSIFQSKSWYWTGGVNWTAALADLTAKTRRVRISTGQSIDELLLASDLLITDVSGLGPEFLSLEKPVVFLPAEKFFNLFGRDRAEMWCRDQPEPTNAIELRAAIVDALAGQRSRMPVETLVYNKGRSPEAAMRAIESLLG